MSRHPTQPELQRWLESGESPRVSKHVGSCDRCMEALERLSDLDDAMVADLGTALAPPADVELRTARQVDKRLRDEAAITTFIDLFTLGWFATRTILDIEEDSDA